MTGLSAGKIISLPPSKAISIRSLYLPFLGFKSVLLNNIPSSEDFLANLNVVKKIGVKIKEIAPSMLELKLKEGVRWNKTMRSLNIRNSGLGARFLITLLSFSKVKTKFKIGGQLAKRHILLGSEHLKKIGLKIYQRNRYIYIDSRDVNIPKELVVYPFPTSQYLSALLFFGWKFGIRDIKVKGEIISSCYVTTTLKLLQKVGIYWVRKGESFSIEKIEPLSEVSLVIPPDATSASVFMVYAAITQKTIVLRDFKASSIEPDFCILKMLQNIGCKFDFWGNDLKFFGRIKKEYAQFDLKNNPDLLPVLTILLLFLRKGGEINNVYNARFKESPRNIVLARELKKIGVRIIERGEELKIEGNFWENVNLKKRIRLNSHGDHRIFMAFSILSAIVPNITVAGRSCVSKSYPEFIKVFS
jgi:3-phosphoshikimate 1-carboxyvinyltransferase